MALLLRRSQASTMRAAASSVRRLASAAAAEKLERTALYDLHVELGGKMVPFAGYELPVQYPDGVLKSHLHTRAKGAASLFDVGHMGQIRWHGKDRAAFLEKLVVADVKELKEGESKLTLVTNAKGGIIDDSVLTNHGNYIYMVVNGATKHGDMAHFDGHLAAFKAAGGDVSYEYLHSQNLVALQGAAAPAVLARLVDGATAVTHCNVLLLLFTAFCCYECMTYDACIRKPSTGGYAGYTLSVPAYFALVLYVFYTFQVRPRRLVWPICLSCRAVP